MNPVIMHINYGEMGFNSFGCRSVDDICRMAAEIGFDGVLTIESAPGYTFECFGEDADRGIFNDYDYWKKCLNTAKQ